MQLSEAQKIVDEWITTIGVKYYSELTNTAILMEETGEVARLMARICLPMNLRTSFSYSSVWRIKPESISQRPFVKT